MPDELVWRKVRGSTGPRLTQEIKRARPSVAHEGASSATGGSSPQPTGREADQIANRLEADGGGCHAPVDPDLPPDPSVAPAGGDPDFGPSVRLTVPEDIGRLIRRGYGTSVRSFPCVSAVAEGPLVAREWVVMIQPSHEVGASTGDGGRKLVRRSAAGLLDAFVSRLVSDRDNCEGERESTAHLILETIKGQYETLKNTRWLWSE